MLQNSPTTSHPPGAARTRRQAPTKRFCGAFEIIPVACTVCPLPSYCRARFDRTRRRDELLPVCLFLAVLGPPGCFHVA